MTDRLKQATAIHNAGMERVKNDPYPNGQKFPPGTRVKIADDLGSMMSHFPNGVNATVLYTYAHAFPQFDKNATNLYFLDVDGCGECGWYYENQLTELESNNEN